MLDNENGLGSAHNWLHKERRSKWWATIKTNPAFACQFSCGFNMQPISWFAFWQSPHGKLIEPKIILDCPRNLKETWRKNLPYSRTKSRGQPLHFTIVGRKFCDLQMISCSWYGAHCGHALRFMESVCNPKRLARDCVLHYIRTIWRSLHPYSWTPETANNWQSTTFQELRQWMTSANSLKLQGR